MVHVEYELYENDFRLAVRGHAGYAEKGKDIVCAGISALMRALQVCFEQELFLSDAAYVEKVVRDGFAHFAVQGIEDSELEARIFYYFHMCIKGLRELEKQYPDYITVTDITALNRASDIDTPEQTAENE